MRRRSDVVARAIAAGLLMCGGVPALAAQACGHFPGSGFDASDMFHVQGRYVNAEYRYSVVLPQGLTAYAAPAPAPDHGVGIVLSWEPRSYLNVDGAYDVLDWKTPSGAARQLLQWTRESSSRVLSHVQSRARLGSLRSLRLVVRHRCASLPDVYVDDDVVAVDAKNGVVFKVALTTTDGRYRQDKAVMDQLLSTWRALP